MIDRRHFGNLATGEDVELFTLANDSGLRMCVMTYGGTITELHVPDGNGETADVVLGFDRLEPYLAGHPFFGCITGRVAGRISGGRLELDGQTIPLVINEAPNHLHGGEVGLDKRLWTPEPHDDPVAPSLSLTYRSPHGEEGYPGNVDISVRYTLDGSSLVISYEAVTDQTTVLSLTNHSYFNLAGEGNGTGEDHLLEIFADAFVPTDEDMTLSGRSEPVCAESNDFRTPRCIGDAVPKLWKEHGDGYCLRDRTTDIPELAARLTDPTSGRAMETYTTETCLQFYAGKYLDGSAVGKSGQAYGPLAGVCLECHGYPDGARHPEFGDITLRPGKTYRQQTIYTFSTGI